jgi:hypothetical protein
MSRGGDQRRSCSRRMRREGLLQTLAGCQRATEVATSLALRRMRLAKLAQEALVFKWQDTGEAHDAILYQAAAPCRLPLVDREVLSPPPFTKNWPTPPALLGQNSGARSSASRLPTRKTTSLPGTADYSRSRGVRELIGIFVRE